MPGSLVNFGLLLMDVRPCGFDIYFEDANVLPEELRGYLGLTDASGTNRVH